MLTSYKVTVDLKALIYAILSPREPITDSSLLGGTTVSRSTANLISQFEGHKDYVEISRIHNPLLHNYEYIIWLRHEWESTARKEAIKKKESEIRRKAMLIRDERLTKTIGAVARAFPHVAEARNGMKLIADLLDYWIEMADEDEDSRNYLIKFNFFKGEQSDNRAIEELKKELEVFKAATLGDENLQRRRKEPIL